MTCFMYTSAASTLVSSSPKRCGSSADLGAFVLRDAVSFPTAIWTAALVVGINITPVLAGQILNKPELGYVWVFRYVSLNELSAPRGSH